MAPLIESKKLFAFLVQFSGTFGCTKENVAYLQKFVTGLKTYPSPLNYEIIHGINQTL